MGFVQHPNPLKKGFIGLAQDFSVFSPFFHGAPSENGRLLIERRCRT
jgi:hypothetical protein